MGVDPDEVRGPGPVPVDGKVQPALWIRAGLCRSRTAGSRSWARATISRVPSVLPRPPRRRARQDAPPRATAGREAGRYGAPRSDRAQRSAESWPGWGRRQGRVRHFRRHGLSLARADGRWGHRLPATAHPELLRRWTRKLCSKRVWAAFRPAAERCLPKIARVDRAIAVRSRIPPAATGRDRGARPDRASVVAATAHGRAPRGVRQGESERYFRQGNRRTTAHDGEALQDRPAGTGPALARDLGASGPDDSSATPMQASRVSVHDRCRRHARQRAFTCVVPNGMNGTLGFERLDALSDHFAAFLHHYCGVRHGTRVAFHAERPCLSRRRLRGVQGGGGPREHQPALHAVRDDPPVPGFRRRGPRPGATCSPTSWPR